VYSFQLTKNVIGIDIGSYSLKIAECQRAGNKVALLKYAIRPMPKPSDPTQTLSRQEISIFINETLLDLGIRMSDAVSEVTGPWTVARHLYMPDLSDDEMREAIRWGAKAEFPFSLEEAAIDYYKLGVLKREEGEPEAEIVSAAATREAIEDHVTLFREAGLKPILLSIPSFNLMQAYRFTQPSPWEETAAVIDLGYKNTRIVILKEGKLKFSREISVAGDAFTQFLTGTYDVDGQKVEIDEPTAERIKIQIGLLEEEPGRLIEGIPLDQIHKRLSSVMDHLLLEIERSFNYYKNQFKDYEIKKVFLTGGGSLLNGLPEAMEKNLEIPIQHFQTAGKLHLKKNIKEALLLKDLPFLATILGLVTQTQPFINLSPRYLSTPTKRFSLGKLLKPALVSVIPLAVIFFFASQYWTASQQAAKLHKELIAKKEQLARLDKPVEEMARLEQEEARLNIELEGFPRIEIKKLPLNDLLQELSRLVPSNMTLTRFEFSRGLETRSSSEPAAGSSKPESGTVKPKDTPAVMAKDAKTSEYQVVLQGVTFGSDQEILATLTAFTGNLNRSHFFKEAKVQKTKKIFEYSKNAAEYEILAKLGEGVNRKPGMSF
jgi:type IV pilus assembly protein PilM